MSYGSFSALILSSSVTITLYTSSSRFFQKLKVLFDGRLVSMSENKYGFAVNFLYKCLYAPKSTWDEWLVEICWSSRLLGIFIIKNCVVFNHTFFGSWNWDCKMNTKEIFCFRLLINRYCNWLLHEVFDYWLYQQSYGRKLSKLFFIFLDCSRQYCWRHHSYHLSIL